MEREGRTILVRNYVIICIIHKYQWPSQPTDCDTVRLLRFWMAIEIEPHWRAELHTADGTEFPEKG